eukprot:m.1106843 g.1106843  ORF g.1106843 m.1106843 type:complete len:578 (-) comp24345_c0_seq23:4131-5864(-)
MALSERQSPSRVQGMTSSKNDVGATVEAAANTLAASTGVTDIDDILDRIGQFGSYQQKEYASIFYTWLSLAAATLSLVFVSPTAVPWRCLDTSDMECTSEEIQTSTDSMNNLCSIIGGNRTYAWEFTKPEDTVTAEFGLICAESWKTSFLGSIFFLGFAFGAALFGDLSDRIGRRKSYILALSSMAVSMTLSAMATSYGSFAAARFIVGASSSGVGLVSFVMSSEIIGKHYRTKTSMLIQVAFACGEVALAGIAYRVPEWRSQTFLLVALLTPSLVYAIWWQRESPRWQQSKNDLKGATATLRAIARGNRRAYPLHLLLVDPPKVAAAEAVSIKSLFTHPVLRQRQLIMMTGWFTCSFLYYGLSFASSSLTGNPYTDFTWSAIAEIPGVILAMYGMEWERTGRRGTLVSAFWLAGGACLALVFCVTSSPAVRTVLAFGGKLGISGAFAIVYVYPVELFPTSARSGAIGLSSMCSRMGGILAPQMILLQQFGKAAPFVVFCVPAVVSALASRLLPETRGQPLPQTLADVTPGARTPDVSSGSLPHHVTICKEYTDAEVSWGHNKEHGIPLLEQNPRQE